MKRFLTVVAILFVLLVAVSCDEMKKQEKVCVCKEGEKNCPCLAQDNRKEGENKAKEPKEQIPKMNKEKLIKKLSSKLLLKKIAPAEEKLLRELKFGLHDAKSKMKVLKYAIKKSSADKKGEIITKRQFYKNKCAIMKKEIKDTKAKLAVLEKQFKDECIRQLSQKEIKANNELKSIAPKIKELKVKIKEIEDTIKVAPEADKPGLLENLKSLNLELGKLKNIKSKAKAFLKKAAAAKERSEAIKQKSEMKHLEKKANKQKVKLAHLKKKETKLTNLLNKLKKKVTTLQAKLKKENVKPEHKHKIKLQIARFSNIIKGITAKLQTTINKENNKVNLKKSLKAKALLIKKTRQENKEKSKCLLLQQELNRELLLMKKLKSKFATECEKAIEGKKKKDMNAVLRIKKLIRSVSKKIEKIRRQIRKVPRKERASLIIKEKTLAKLLERKVLELESLKINLEKTKNLSKGKTGMELAKLKAKQKKQKAKIGKIEKEIVDYEKETKLLKEQHEKVCGEQVAREKMISEKVIKNTKRKLMIAQKNAMELEKALNRAKKIGVLTVQISRLKRQITESAEQSLKKDLEDQLKKIEEKLAKYLKLQEESKKKVRMYQAELDQKSTKDILKQKKQIVKSKKLIEKQIKIALSKQASIEQAINNEKDATIQIALKEELGKINKNLNELKRKLNELEEENEALNHELELQEKAVIEREKERKVKETILAKQNKEKEIQLKMAFFTKAGKAKKYQLEQKKGDHEKELSEYKKKLQIAIAEYTTFKVALKAGNKRKLLDILGQIKKKSDLEIEKLGKDLKEIKIQGQKYQTLLAQTNSAKIKKLTARLTSEAKAKELALNKKINQEIAKSEAAKKAAELNNKNEISKEKERAKKVIAGLEKEISKIRKSMITTSLQFNKDIVKAQTLSDETQSSIDLEKKQIAQEEKDSAAFVKEEEKSLKKKLNSLTKKSSNDIKKVEERIAAVLKKQKLEENELTVALKDTKKGIQDTKKNIQKEIKNYEKLEKEMQTYVVKENKKLVNDVQKEEEKRQKKEKEMEQKTQKCRKELNDEESKLKNLKVDFDNKLDELKNLQDAEKRRVVARDSLSEFENNLLKLKSQGIEIVSNIEAICYDESNTDAAGNCDKLRQDQEKVRIETENMKLKVDNALNEYLKF